MWATIIAYNIVQISPKVIMHDKFQTFCTENAARFIQSLVSWLKNRATPRNTIIIQSVGMLPAFIITCFEPDIRKFAAQHLPRILFGLSSFVNELDAGYSGKTVYKDSIYVKWQPMHTWWTRYLPFGIGHACLYNPVDDVAIGITCGDDSKCQVDYQKSPDIAVGELVFNTGVSLTKWPEAMQYIAAYEDKPYYPMRHCIWSVYEALGNLYQGDDLTKQEQNQITLLLALAVSSALVMTFAGIILLPLGFLFSIPLAELTPAITFAGINGGITSWSGAMKFLAGPSAMLFDGPTIMDAHGKYPITRESDGPLFPSDLRLMKINIGGVDNTYLPPMCGMNRPNYIKGRGGCYKYIHNLTEEGVNSVVTDRQVTLLNELLNAVK
jgi:hypothetical protein